MLKKIIFGGTFISVFIFTGCSQQSSEAKQASSSELSLQKKVVADNSEEMKETEKTNPPTNQFLAPIDGALVSIKAECDEYNKRGRSRCKWEGVSYTVLKPSDWSKELKKIQDGCEAGVFSGDYNVISNGKSWIISTGNGGDPTTRLHAALVKQGGVKPGPKLLKYCDIQ